MGLDSQAYRGDVLVLAGDVSDDLTLLERVLSVCASRFASVLYVPGNHDLWVHRGEFDCSLTKFHAVLALCEELGVATSPFALRGVAFVPLLSWYDYSFGSLDRSLKLGWRDFKACSWPSALADHGALTEHFHAINRESVRAEESWLKERAEIDAVISCSHFLPTLDVMPDWIPESRRTVYPVLGSRALGKQVKELAPDIHVYGHSHVNQAIRLGATCYINNAFATPKETRIAVKRLRCIYDTDNAEVIPRLLEEANAGLLWT